MFSHDGSICTVLDTYKKTDLDNHETLKIDPKTKSWLKANMDPIFGYPNIVRFSWATCKTSLDESAKTVRW